jgi:hypothetical protein
VCTEPVAIANAKTPEAPGNTTGAGGLATGADPGPFPN